MSRIGTVRIRRNIGHVRPEAEAIDGKTHGFTYGWKCDDGRYPGEIAWIPDREGWPYGAPIWVASGDIEWQPPTPPGKPNT